MTRYRPAWAMITLILLVSAGCSARSPFDVSLLADTTVSHTSHDLYMRQDLINDAPIGPGTPQPSSHCPTGPGAWFPGSGRSTATSSIFGDLTEVEVYCINVDRAELSGGLATWIDADGDSISMAFGAKLLEGFVYAAAPSAPLIGYAQFTGGTGKWTGLAGAALLTGRQNGDGTTTLEYHGTVYLPR